MSTTDQTAAVQEAPTLRGARVVILVGALMLTVLAFQLNASLLSPALPAISRDLLVDANAVSQVQSLFFLSGSVLGMVISRWSDTIGRRPALFITLGMLLVGTGLTLIAPSLPVLLAGRILQGSASGSFTIAFLVLAEELTAKQFGIAVGIVTAVNGGLGGLDGYIGGSVTDAFGWRAVFLIILGVSILATVSVIFAVPWHRRSAARRMDWVGAALLAVFLVSLTQLIGALSSNGLSDAASLLWLAGAVGSAVAFVAVERKTRQPLIPVPALRSRKVWPVLMSTFLTLAGVFSSTNFTIILLSQDHKVGYGLDASISGLLYLTPTAFAGVIAATVAGWLAQKMGWVVSLRVSTALLCCFPQPWRSSPSTRGSPSGS
ncbi:MFS transporter [Sinomonas sp. JGH33]|uniref:MFS transporter n=1 Tax=Sinomonas terricola TaxID=3110330 RepID=A0ABU5T8J6_9MICC|nr:MFS transporter [Sinomonas sp. JGH33]MEA5455994.1 MFS transporter [Sinomonas sp. JGH33]